MIARLLIVSLVLFGAEKISIIISIVYEGANRRILETKGKERARDGG